MRKEIRDIIKDEIVTIEEFAALADVSRETVHSAVKRGKIEAEKKGRDWLLDKQDVKRRTKR